ncbi:MAG: hypothetical protein IT206_09695 [Fimbriimonadaceae bacterium]|nr:hypothetical protein [Fimbriimonadaceae bacterium]
MNDRPSPVEAQSTSPRLIQRHAAHKLVHGEGALGRINTWLAVGITKIVGSMWCAYAFVGLSLISLPAALQSHDPITMVGWVAQTFLQLVLLPIIIVGQNVQAASSDARAQSDHDTLVAIHTLTSEVYNLSMNQSKILASLEARSGQQGNL